MEQIRENLRLADKKREIFCETAELLEEAGLFTREEKNRMKDIIWQNERG